MFRTSPDNIPMVSGGESWLHHIHVLVVPYFKFAALQAVFLFYKLNLYAKGRLHSGVPDDYSLFLTLVPPERSPHGVGAGLVSAPDNGMSFHFPAVCRADTRPAPTPCGTILRLPEPSGDVN